jgi:hypothetical protein
MTTMTKTTTTMTTMTMKTEEQVLASWMHWRCSCYAKRVLAVVVEAVVAAEECRISGAK